MTAQRALDLLSLNHLNMSKTLRSCSTEYHLFGTSQDHTNRLRAIIRVFRRPFTAIAALGISRAEQSRSDLPCWPYILETP